VAEVVLDRPDVVSVVGQLFLVVLGGIPTFVWRASAEEKLLTATFGERYARYRKQTKMIIPRFL
jgi:protein-S-isoprenylcysteine O-methyltransferase Ste14